MYLLSRLLDLGCQLFDTLVKAPVEPIPDPTRALLEDPAGNPSLLTVDRLLDLIGSEVPEIVAYTHRVPRNVAAIISICRYITPEQLLLLAGNRGYSYIRLLDLYQRCMWLCLLDLGRVFLLLLPIPCLPSHGGRGRGDTAAICPY